MSNKFELIHNFIVEVSIMDIALLPNDACFEVHQSEELGRYLIAKRNISPLEVVIRERPLVCAPADDPNYEGMGRIPMCLGCFARICSNSSSSVCRKCGWPVCDNECESISHHATNECKFLAENNVPVKALPHPHLLNETIFILRCLLLKHKDPFHGWKIVTSFEHHTKVRQGKEECIEKDRKICDNLKEMLACSKTLWFELCEDEVVKISGILNVNAFSSTKLEDECRSRRVRRRVTFCQCLYPTATLIAHQCIPNAVWSISASPYFEQTIRSAVAIKKGEMISIAYAPQEIMWPTLQRLISSNDVAHFICRCSRCQDPTELGTCIAALKCLECSSFSLSNDDTKSRSYLLPADPIDPESQWNCQNPNCNSTKTIEQVVKIVNRIESKFNRIKKAAYPTANEITQLEQLYEKSLEELHPNHYLLLELSQRIVNRNALSIYCLDSDELERFLYHCDFILRISTILSPGYCRTRAIIQFYSSQAMMVKGRKIRKDRADMTKNQLVEIYTPIYTLQREAFLFFKAEDENENSCRTTKGFNQYVACLGEEMGECFKAMQLQG